MNTIELCKKLEHISYVVIVLQYNKIIDAGTGVAINSNGDIITAAHVITRLPPKQSDLNDSSITIIARRKHGEIREYKPGVTAPTMNSQYFISPMIIDLAILHPIKPQKVPFSSPSQLKITVGTKVLMAGFPDEVELPFSFDRILNYSHPEVPSNSRAQIQVCRQLMIKSGMISYSSEFNFSDPAIDKNIFGDIFYIDNVMHKGSSGGPVIDENGELIGIITQRAITAVPFEETPSLKVPSGSAVAISPKTILQCTNAT